MIAVFVTGDSAARNAEFGRESDAFVTFGTAVSCDGCRGTIGVHVDRILYVMDPMAIRACRRTRNTT